MATLKKSHNRPWQPPRPPQARRVEDLSGFYNNRKWRRLAAQHKEANPLCTACLERGEAAPAEVTDHVRPLRDGGAPYSWGNLQSLCSRCHASKSGREAHGRGGRNL